MLLKLLGAFENLILLHEAILVNQTHSDIRHLKVQVPAKSCGSLFRECCILTIYRMLQLWRVMSYSAQQLYLRHKPVGAQSAFNSH